MNYSKKQFFGLIGLSVAVALPVEAQNLELDEVLVSAGRVPVESEKVGRAHTVISGEELETSQIRYVADALRRVPGLAVSRSGSFGGLTQIRVRGSEGNHVLVLIDGVEVASTSGGEYDFGGLQAADIERIEVLRGPQSALYGSNATSGVIHIITKGGLRNDYRFTAQSELGSDGTELGRLGVQGGGETFDFALSGSYRKTDGFNISSQGDEDDGDKNTTLNGKLNWDLSDDVSLDLNLRYVDRDSDTDNQSSGVVVDSVGSYVKTEEVYAGAGLNWALLDGQFVQKTQAEFSELKSRGSGSFGSYGNNDHRYHLSHQGTYFFDTSDDAKHSLTGAVEAERETYQNAFPTLNPSQRGTRERDLLGYAAEYKGEFSERLFVSTAVRHDDNDDFKDATTYSASAAYLWSDSGTRLHGSFGKGVTNPTFFEQFGFIPATFTGNPNLKPEENNGWDIGVEQAFMDDLLIVDLTYFNERLENEIKTQSNTAINQDGTSDREGAELSVQLNLTDDLYVKGSYTYLEAFDPDGQEEVRRPMHSGAVNVAYSFDNRKGNFFVDTIFNGEMQDSDFRTFPSTRVSLDSYTVVNVGADYQINDQFQVYGRVENLLNEEYEEVFGYNTQGITSFVGVKATF